MLTAERHDFLDELEADSSLLAPQQLRERLEVLDALDAGFGDFGSPTLKEGTDGRIYSKAQAIRSRLEAINAKLYQSIRSEMQRGLHRQTLLQWIQAPTSGDKKGNPAPGFAYDYRDELLSGILQFREPVEVSLQLAREMVFYQPTPVRHILNLISTSALSVADVFVDLGSGLGHVPLLASMLTGARSLGIEVQAAYVASAQQCAQSLHVSGVRFIHEDARNADLRGGTVFYLYSPFTGSILANVLNRLRQVSTIRPIRICTLGPGTSTVAKESWLKPDATPDPDQITVFHAGF